MCVSYTTAHLYGCIGTRVDGALVFLVSRSLTLPAAQPDEPQALFDDFPYAQKEKKNGCFGNFRRTVLERVEFPTRNLYAFRITF